MSHAVRRSVQTTVQVAVDDSPATAAAASSGSTPGCGVMRKSAITSVACGIAGTLDRSIGCRLDGGLVEVVHYVSSEGEERAMKATERIAEKRGAMGWLRCAFNVGVCQSIGNSRFSSAGLSDR